MTFLANLEQAGQELITVIRDPSQSEASERDDKRAQAGAITNQEHDHHNNDDAHRRRLERDHSFPTPAQQPGTGKGIAFHNLAAAAADQ